MKLLYTVYNAVNGAVYEDAEGGELELVVDNAVVASATPNHPANYSRLADMRQSVLSRYYADGNRAVCVPA